MIRRTFNATEVNRICNDPAVFPYVAWGHPYPLDMAPVVERRENVVFVGEHGFVVFFQLPQSGVYEVHAAVLPTGRGAWTRLAGREALQQMFDAAAEALLFPCPRGNPMARPGAKMLGAKKVGESSGIEFYLLRKAEWLVGQPAARDHAGVDVFAGIETRSDGSGAAHQGAAGRAADDAATDRQHTAREPIGWRHRGEPLPRRFVAAGEVRAVKALCRRMRRVGVVHIGYAAGKDDDGGERKNRFHRRASNLRGNVGVCVVLGKAGN